MDGRRIRFDRSSSVLTGIAKKDGLVEAMARPILQYLKKYNHANAGGFETKKAEEKKAEDKKDDHKAKKEEEETEGVVPKEIMNKPS